VNLNSKLVISPLRRNYRAALTYGLLLMIAYGALVETVHSHGHVPPGHSDVAICDAGGSKSSDDGNSLHRECSMCQFQRQLFDAFVPATLFARISLSEIAFVSTLTVAYPSTSITPRSGRAPPFTCT
jgi:hypothetical protein